MERASNISGGLNDVFYANGTFVAVVPSGTIATSADLRPQLPVRDPILQPDAPLCVSVESVLGTRYELESSSGLLSWTTLASFTNTTGVVEICDPVGTGQRFYRTKSLIR